MSRIQFIDPSLTDNLFSEYPLFPSLTSQTNLGGFFTYRTTGLNGDFLFLLLKYVTLFKSTFLLTLVSNKEQDVTNPEDPIKTTSDQKSCRKPILLLCSYDSVQTRKSLRDDDDTNLSLLPGPLTPSRGLRIRVRIIHTRKTSL